MFRITTHNIFPRIFGVVLTLLLTLMLLSACNVSTDVPTQAPTATLVELVVATASPTATAAPTQEPTGSAGQSAVLVTVDANGVAEDITTQVIEAVAPGDNVGWTDVMPQYTLLTLEGYPITNHQKMPQIFVYPVKDLGVNEKAVNNAENLRTLLETQQAGDQLPYLPLEFSVKQGILSQVKYLDFPNGKGVRFLTQWNNGLAPINNNGLIYTYQGLTSDGKYYVAVVLPVNLEGLPVNSFDTSRLPQDFPNDYSNYLADTVSLLGQNPDGAYTPDLSKLDAMVQSIEIK